MNDEARGCLTVIAGLAGGILLWFLLKFVWSCIGWIFQLIDALFGLCCDFFDDGFIITSIRAFVCVTFIALVLMGINAFFNNK